MTLGPNGGCCHHYRNNIFSCKPILQFGAAPFISIFVALSFYLRYLPCFWHSDKSGYAFSKFIHYVLVGQGYSTNFNEGPVGEVQYVLRSSPVELLICRKIVEIRQPNRWWPFFFGDHPTISRSPKKEKKGHHLFGSRKSNYFSAYQHFYLKKRSRTEIERPVSAQLLLIALTVTHPKARGPALTLQRSGFGPRSASWVAL